MKFGNSPVYRLQFFTKDCQNHHHIFTQSLAGGRNICKRTVQQGQCLTQTEFQIIKKQLVLLVCLVPLFRDEMNHPSVRVSLADCQKKHLSSL